MRATLDNPDNAPIPRNRYSQVARLDFGTGTLLILSGQVALADDGELVAPNDMAAQSERVFAIIGALLAAHGATFDHVVQIRTFLTDISRIREYGQVRDRYITGTPPTSTTVEVSRLFRPGAVVEVEVVAAIGAS
jgi:enamine deaminase RidA (YjgF/YER057c/UK114 family)